MPFPEVLTTSTLALPLRGRSSFTYGCRARIGDVSIFSGWRNVAVGTPTVNGPIPVTYTGPPSKRLDIVFVADSEDYSGGSSNPDFLVEANRVIRDAFGSNEVRVKK